jgi:hypothetical protein
MLDANTGVSGSVDAGQNYRSSWTADPVSLFIAPHPFLHTIVTGQQVGLMERMDVLVVEWNDDGYELYRDFIKGLKANVCPVVVDNPTFCADLKHLIDTGDDSRFHTYDQARAKGIVNAVLSNWNKSIGIVAGQGPWDYAKKSLDDHQVPYTPVIMRRY